MTELHWADIDITIRYTVEEYHMDFELREGYEQEDGTIVYGNGDGSFSSGFEEGERFVGGSVKWDGCSHLTFGDERGYLHLCGGRGYKRLAEALHRTFLLASQGMPKFANDVAETSALLPQ